MIIIHPVRKTGTKTVVHITSKNREELVQAAKEGKVGVRNMGTPQEHISVTPSTSGFLQRIFVWWQAEEDIFDK